MDYTQFTRLLTTPPGDLVYHLVVLFSIEAALMLALNEGQRAKWAGGAVRLTVATLSLLLVRFAPVVAALLSTSGIVNAALISPPLERLVAVVSLGLIAWACLPLIERYPQAGLVLAVVNTVAALIAYAVFAPQWYTTPSDRNVFYNAMPADMVWNVWAVALSALALLAALVRRRAQWGMLVVVFALLLMGHALHLFAADMQSNSTGWVRLGELCAYPLLAGLMLRRVSERDEATLTPANTPWTAIEVCQRVADALNLHVALQRAGAAISTILGADVLAIGLLNETGDTVELGAVCRTGMPARSGPAFDLDSQLPVHAVVNRQRGLLVSDDQEAQRATLSALVGGAVGPLWVQPLIYQRVALGVLIIGRANAPGGWTTGEMQTLNGLSNVLATSLSAAYKAAALSRQVDELSQSLRNREKETPPPRTDAKKETPPRSAIPASRPPARRPVSVARSASPFAADASPATDGERGPFYESFRRLQQISDAQSRLTSVPNDRETLFGLYRATNSLKEMSAAMGYNTLAKLAGTLAETLQRVRDAQQPLSAEMLGLIGDCTTALKSLLSDAQADRSPSLDVTPLLRRLESPVERSAPLRRASVATVLPTPAASATLNERTLTALVQLEPNAPLRATRAMMVLAQIKRMGQVVACQPVEADLRSGGFEDEFSVTFTTPNDPETVKAALSTVRDVVNVSVE